MVPIRRLVDRYFALGLAVAPVWTTVGYSAAWAWAVGSLAVLAVALVLYGPSHDSGEAWRFGGATLLTHVAVSLALEQGLGYRLADHPLATVAVWVAAVAVAFAHVYRRRRRDPTQDTSRR